MLSQMWNSELFSAENKSSINVQPKVKLKEKSADSKISRNKQLKNVFWHGLTYKLSTKNYGYMIGKLLCC